MIKQVDLRVLNTFIDSENYSHEQCQEDISQLLHLIEYSRTNRGFKNLQPCQSFILPLDIYGPQKRSRSVSPKDVMGRMKKDQKRRETTKEQTEILKLKQEEDKINQLLSSSYANGKMTVEQTNNLVNKLMSDAYRRQYRSRIDGMTSPVDFL